MKQIILSLFLVFSVLAILDAQSSIIVSPNPVQETFSVDLSDQFVLTDSKAVIRNNSETQVRLKWVLEVVEAPEGWEVSVCDNNACYTPNIISNIDASIGINAPLVLMPGDTSLLDARVLPNFVGGSGKVKVHLSMSDDPDNVFLTVDYEITVQDQTTSVSEVEKNKIRIFPNPTSDYIQLTNNSIVDHLDIYNVVGRKVRSFQANFGGRYDISNLPNGLYLVSLMNEKEGVLKTLRLRKRSGRP